MDNRASWRPYAPPLRPRKMDTPTAVSMNELRGSRVAARDCPDIPCVVHAVSNYGRLCPSSVVPYTGCRNRAEMATHQGIHGHPAVPWSEVSQGWVANPARRVRSSSAPSGDAASGRDPVLPLFDQGSSRVGPRVLVNQSRPHRSPWEKRSSSSRGGPPSAASIRPRLGSQCQRLRRARSGHAWRVAPDRPRRG